MKVLHCPIDIGGNASGLAGAQRGLGISAFAVTLRESPLGFNGDECLTSQDTSLLLRESARFRLLSRALQCDVIHFYFGETILTPRRFPDLYMRSPVSITERLRAAYARLVWMKDLPLLAGLGKTLAMTFLGDDARLVSHAQEKYQCSHLHVPELAHLYGARDPTKQRMIAKVDRYVDLIYTTNPDLLEILPARARFLPYCNIHLRAAKRRSFGTRPLIVGHAPTDRRAKGTSLILAAIEELRGRGLEFEFRLIEGHHHLQSREYIGELDILIDQLLVGWFGGVAVEAMEAGTIVMAYLRDSDIERSPFEAHELPIKRTTAETFTEDLEQLIRMSPADLAILSDKSNSFVRQAFNPERTARSVVQDYELAMAKRRRN